MSDVTTEVREGDCKEVMGDMEDDSIHAITTDPPYGLEFMSRDWDDLGSKANAQVNWHQEWMEKAYDVLKPGGHMLVFGGNRTHHYVMMAAEFAGFEIRDTITWHYGSGYPKGVNVDKKIDEMNEEEREVIGTKTFTQGGGNSLNMREGEEREVEHEYTKPSSEEAEKWEGWNSTLKPATEYVLVARKPMSEGTIAENVLKHGTGAYNVDACRIGDIEREKQRSTGEKVSENTSMSGANTEREVIGIKEGRHPANVVFDAIEAGKLDEIVGDLPGPWGSNSDSVNSESSIFGVSGGVDNEKWASDSGGPSRYFYTSKASKKERTVDGELENDHPTVKPVDLMEWLVRLVTKEGQRVLDPFSGSGTTVLATWNTARSGVGIERESKHAETARERLEANKTNRSAVGTKPTHDHGSALEW